MSPTIMTWSSKRPSIKISIRCWKRKRTGSISSSHSMWIPRSSLSWRRTVDIRCCLMNAPSLIFTRPFSPWSRSISTMKPRDFYNRKRTRWRIWWGLRKDVAVWSHNQSKITSSHSTNASWSVISSSKDCSTLPQMASSFKKNHGIPSSMGLD